MQPIKTVDLASTDVTSFTKQNVGCLILTHDNQILLQQRDPHSPTFPDCLATFGGALIPHETPMQALIRELHEELGAVVAPAAVINLGAITEAITNYTALIYVYFWHDTTGTITGCYEGKAVRYSQWETALKHPKIMDDVKWLLQLCSKQNLIPQRR